MKEIKPHVRQRQYLVVIRLGDDATLHHKWMSQIFVPRNWDMLISYYGDNVDWNPQECEGAYTLKGQKWPAIQTLFNNKLMDGYEYIWFPDVDIDTSTDSINKLFEMCAIFNLDLAQPALCDNSWWSHDITKQNSTSILRFTNFVEMMMPVFKNTALAQCVSSFDTEGVAWGLDFVWSKLLGHPKNSIAIVDAISMTHTKQAGGAYDMQHAMTQMQSLMEKYQVTACIEQYGFITRLSS